MNSDLHLVTLAWETALVQNLICFDEFLLKVKYYIILRYTLRPKLDDRQHIRDILILLHLLNSNLEFLHKCFVNFIFYCYFIAFSLTLGFILPCTDTFYCQH